MNAAKEDKKALNNTISDLKKEIDTLGDNSKLLNQQIKDIMEINKELRKALAVKYKIGKFIRLIFIVELYGNSMYCGNYYCALSVKNICL